MDGVERFRNVMLDFAGVDAVGRSLVDEIFRVFPRRHPEADIRAVNMAAEVEREVARVLREDAN